MWEYAFKTYNLSRRMERPKTFNEVTRIKKYTIITSPKNDLKRKRKTNLIFPPFRCLRANISFLALLQLGSCNAQ